MRNGPGRIWFKRVRNKFFGALSGLSQAGASAYSGAMDLNALMKQAQAMQQKLQSEKAVKQLQGMQMQASQKQE